MDRRRRVPVVAPAEIRIDWAAAAAAGGIHIPAADAGGLSAVNAVPEEAEGAVGGAGLEGAEGEAGRHVEVGAAHAVIAGSDPGV